MKKKIAIVGMSFRFPGTNADRYWDDLLAGKDLVTAVDPSRWAQETYLHSGKNHPGSSYTFAAGSLGDVSLFDADFFGISPREAVQMDPQQRLLLEMSWEAIESSGIKPSTMRGSGCGVFIGIASADYSYRFADDLGAIDSKVATGNTSSIAANRISYVFDLRGPSMALDTACSSSLVAFHQACQSIRAGESSMAIAGGVSLHLHPFGFIAFSKATMLSRRGRCNVFDASGDGYVRSEGGGIFVLKDYDRASADGDPILAVVAASAVNSDGKKSGLTIPSSEAQAALLQSSYVAAGIEPEEIDYIEAHGTGTAVGDPIETRALGDALAKFRDKQRPLLIGSVKSNLGHLEAASGVAGLVKAIYCLKNRLVPATIGINKLNPNIPFDDWNLRVVESSTPLKAAGRLVVGVNSFGFGGANAHVVLETPAAKIAKLDPVKPKPRVEARLPIIVSAKTSTALLAAASEMASYLRQHADTSLYDIAYSAAHCRELHEHRAVVSGTSHKSIASSLEQFSRADGGRHDVDSGTALNETATVAFVYSGNGSQWEGMGRVLIESNDTFANALNEVDKIFCSYADFSLRDELLGKNGSNRLDRTEIAQPLLFAIQVGVTQMLRAQGLKPAAACGHSVGEIAAAWATGALTLEQAVQVIFHRSKLQGTTKGGGGMTAAAVGEVEMSALLAQCGLQEDLAIAGINSARGVTLAGSLDALSTCEAALSQSRIAFKRLALDYAFHSKSMDSIESGVYKALATFTPHESSIPFVSTVTGAQLSGSLLGAYYWWQNIRNPVRFEQAMNSLHALGCRVFIEIGPSAVLRGYMIEATKAKSAASRVLTTLARGDDDAGKVWSAVARAMIAGVPVDQTKHFPWAGRFVALPAYPWQRERFWLEPTAESFNLLQRKKLHPLLGYRQSQQQNRWENQIDLVLNPTLADHVVGDATLFPGSGFAELALAAALRWTNEERSNGVVEIEELEVRAPLLLDADHAKSIRVDVDASDGTVSIFARPQFSEEAWTPHAVGRIAREAQRVLHRDEQVHLSARSPDFTGDSHVSLTRSLGLHFGPAYQAIDYGWREGNTVWAKLAPHASIRAELEHHHLHPALLDGAFQLIAYSPRDLADREDENAYVPVKIGRLVYQIGGAAPAFAKATLVRFSGRSLTAHFSLFDEQRRLIAWVRDVRFRSVRLRSDQNDRVGLLNYGVLPSPSRASIEFAVTGFGDELSKSVLQSTKRLSQDAALRAYTEQIEPLLDVLCTAFAIETLRRRTDEHGVISDHNVAAHVDGNPESSALLERLIRMLVEYEVLARIESGWRFEFADDIPSPHDVWNALLADYPEHFSLIQAVGRVGLHLAELLDGKISLAKALPQDCSLGNILMRLLGAAGQSAIVQSVQARVVAAVARLPEGQRFRIVEISDGSNLFAASLHKNLDPRCGEYLFATSNPDAIEAFDHRSERWEGVATQLLDGEAAKDTTPLPVGRAGKYQLALLVNDFKNAADARAALRHAVTLLAPGGTLMMVGMPSSRWLDMVFGANRDWWHDLSEASSVFDGHSIASWQRQLLETGFDECKTIPLLPNAITSPYVIVATSRGEPLQRPVLIDLSPQPVWLIASTSLAMQSDVANRVATSLSAHAAAAIAVELGADVETLSASLREIKSRNQAIAGVVCVAGVLLDSDRTANTAESVALLLAAQTSACDAIARLMTACEQAGLAGKCVIVTMAADAHHLPGRVASEHAAANAPLLAFGRTLANESSALSIRLIDIECDSQSALPGESALNALAQEILLPDDEIEVLMTRDGQRFVPRLRAAPRYLTPSAKPSLSTTHRLGFQNPGQLRNLRWEAFPRAVPKADEIEIEVAATGLNFRDVMYALGLLSDEAVENGFAGPTLGLECAGVVIAVGAEVEGFGLGDRVVAFGPSSFSNHVTTKALAVSRIPPGISFEAAATIPSTFFTAYYAIHHLARLREGERILIHGAAGGVGIAAIQLAKWLGAEIYATAGSDDKRDFLRLLGVDHIFDSRSLAFADEILAVTAGEGVDVVLNSLAGEAINRNLRVLKPFGRFLELGKRDFYENTKIGLRPFRNNISYFGIDADQLMQEHPKLTQTLFGEVMALFDNGTLQPLPFHVFEADDVVDAFRYMQQAKQIGKIVVAYRDGINVVHTPKPVQAPMALKADATYLVTGGLGGFGLRTAQWLVEKGARNLVLLGRRGIAGPEAEAAVAEMAARGIRVWPRACDVTDANALDELFAEMTALPPLRGVIHAAAVIEDALIRNTDAGKMSRVFAPKVAGAAHLHRLTQKLRLDFFVMYSSATTLFGNPGQASYVAANSYLEALAAMRRDAGLPALCVRWGAIDDVGFLARNEQIKAALEGRMGGRAVPSSAALAMLEELMVTDRSGLAVMELDWKAMSRFLPTARAPKFAELAAFGGDSESLADGAADIRRLMAELSPAELASTVRDLLKREIGEILRIATEKIEDERSVYDMGLDSLMGVELALAIESRFGIRLPVMTLSESPTIAKLADRIIVQLHAGDTAIEGSDVDTLAAQAQQLVAQHAAGIDEKAVREFAEEMHAGNEAKSRKTSRIAP